MTKNWKNSIVEEGEESTGKQREEQKEITIFYSMRLQYFCVASCNNNAIFVRSGLICLERLGFLQIPRILYLKIT